MFFPILIRDLNLIFFIQSKFTTSLRFVCFQANSKKIFFQLSTNFARSCRFSPLIFYCCTQTNCLCLSISLSVCFSLIVANVKSDKSFTSLEKTCRMLITFTEKVLRKIVKRCTNFKNYNDFTFSSVGFSSAFDSSSSFSSAVEAS